ncbi:MAG: GNAT family N-acetyltransferase [Lachnospiraceae bacterium]|jgi:ribosomal protein S18 acetylase RimI-like enzyme|nr:GNAT family N-acetyltransferase [Lachnospiraceae bacterium]
MKTIETDHLNPAQRRRILALVDACKQAEPLTLAFPFPPEEDDEPGAPDTMYFLRYDSGQLVSALFLFAPPGDAHPEILCFTHPDHRRRGHFRSLLHRAMRSLCRCSARVPPQNVSTPQIPNSAQAAADAPAFQGARAPWDAPAPSVHILADGLSPSALAALSHIGAAYSYSEYMMRIPTQAGATFRYGAVTNRSEYTKRTPCTNTHTGAPFSLVSDGKRCTAFLAGERIGSCKLTPYGKSLYLFDFKIVARHRRKGYGELFLRQLLYSLSCRDLPGSDCAHTPSTHAAAPAIVSTSAPSPLDAAPAIVSTSAPSTSDATPDAAPTSAPPAPDATPDAAPTSAPPAPAEAQSAAVSWPVRPPYIYLQVSDRNVAAFRLYQKTGFAICETLSFYEYAVIWLP